MRHLTSFICFLTIISPYWSNFHSLSLIYFHNSHSEIDLFSNYLSSTHDQWSGHMLIFWGKAFSSSNTSCTSYHQDPNLISCKGQHYRWWISKRRGMWTQQNQAICLGPIQSYAIFQLIVHSRSSTFVCCRWISSFLVRLLCVTRRHTIVRNHQVGEWMGVWYACLLCSKLRIARMMYKVRIYGYF